ncbi:MAG TPA: ABC transporter permease [Desulfuromonadales bacterium]|nr:ABC transporter permease [Desulfuromonadales bacterium]
MAAMWWRIMALVKKEFLALVKDRKSRTVLVAPPLIQLIIFGYAATYDLNRIPYAVYNEDPGIASRELLSRFEGSETFRLVENIQREEQIATFIDAKEALVVLRLGPSFSRDLLLGEPAEMQLIVDGRNSNTAAIVSGYVQDIVMRFSDRWMETHDSSTPARLNIRAWYNSNLESQWFIVPGIVGLLTLVITMLVTALSVAREREAGTFDQLLVTPFRPVEILLGKALPGVIIGFIEATLIIGVAVSWFQVPLRGSLPALYLGLFLFLLSSIGVGLMISSMAVTQQQGLLGAFLFLVPAIILSGFATPIANMPEPVQILTLVNPLRYFMVILRGVFLEGGSMALFWPQYWPMALIGVITLALAGTLFRRRMY